MDHLNTNRCPAAAHHYSSAALAAACLLLGSCFCRSAAPGPASGHDPLAAATNAWKEVLQASEPPDPPDGWAKQAPTPKDIERFHRHVAAAAARAAGKARRFYTRFPDHPKALRARVKECELLAVAVHLGESDLKSKLESAQKALRQDPGLNEDDRFAIRSAGVEEIAYYLQFKNYTVNLDDFEKSVRELRREFPRRDEPYELLLTVAKNRFYEDQMIKARAVADELAGSEAPPLIVDAARAMVKHFEMIGGPVAFKFTGLDGRKVDLEKLRGNVVLLDCWATWCVPCIGEVPHLKAAYERYHAGGLEIVGISSDDDKEALEKFLKEKQISWPQYFDGKGELNRFALEFDITGVPTMWLLDRKGNLRDLNARNNLDAKIKTFLQE